ncbi:MAG: thiamine diphosphokinase [Devosia sp.]|uniref:thiamine diphosphokinase n=1 Tax=Devosia sp. TaxID=1871048 RepID=UPI0024CD2FDB|nr:thiamine diphosphokinase [Devosia sp.]UYN98225.1 MAG: thiamine diphosphokinase [Devosia sp.]
MQSPPKGPDGPLPLQYEQPIAIVGGGSVDQQLLADLARRGIPLIGADGGGDTIGAAGLVPEAIIGDLDSLSDRAAWESRTRVVHIAEQLTTDFQKCLYSTSAPVTLAVGMTGKRLDHTLAALNAVLQVAADRHLLVIDETDIALAVVGPIGFAARPDERVSVHPLLPIRFHRSTGLLYPLDGLTLEPGGLGGTSNAATAGRVEIIPANPTPWLLILGRERLWDMVETCLEALPRY